MIKTTPQIGSYEFAAQEDRSAPRYRLSIPGYLRAVGGKRLVTTTRDISLSGFAAVAIDQLTPGTRCWLSLPDASPRQAQVIWWERGLVGCAFSQILSPADLIKLIERWDSTYTR